MTILITGANGFVGGNVSRYLTAQGLVCLALDIAGAPEQGAYAARYTWDALEAIPWSEVDAVIHLAGKAHDTKNTSDPQSYFDINVGLTKKILEKCANSGMRECGNAGETPRQEKCANARMRECANGGMRECANGAPRQGAADPRQTPRQGGADPSQCANEGEGSSDQSTHELAHSRIRALKFIFFSSVKACADTVEGVLTEDAQPLPQTPYGKSKLEAEKEVLKFESSKVLKLKMKDETGNLKLGEEEREVLKFEPPSLKLRRPGSSKVLKCNGPDMQCSEAGEGLSDFRTLELQNFRTYILRPAMIHGPGNKGNLNLLVKVVQKGIPWPLGAFENQRSFTSIENVSRVLEALIKTDVEPGTYQVADDQPLSTNQVIGLIAESLGRRPKLWRIPRSFMKGVACLGDILHLPLNSERLKKLTESYVVSNRKLLWALGWQKMPVSAPEGMRATLIATTKWSQ